ncbi:MAG: bifunctional diaminohydroxyphosphoribosylaminopyrimidine deaminase/5-amino-6-(5-phosphoribosylamino)uracil reductase RibD [Flavobacteriaceae bacterium]|nr:bifunctional diaminohydroxyphosphoribosylaminopyrimidine deaminase/5-amino-6-(5-phosphoribosylamino)uracil reductase RibD [Flavobacteriaceae bacterium]
MSILQHEKYMQRCLQIAKNGIGSTKPNPSVGAVILWNDLIVGEGYTSSYGGNHAEVNAINSVKDTSLLKEATIYVTLEPCAHVGKTPPCADLIVKHQIKNVVIGCVDTNSLVAGKGIERLKKAGINVIVGVLEKECLEHHKRFFTVQNKKRPYIILKWAETKNGFIAPLIKEEQKPVWISNSYSQQLVHKWRSEEHAILVGTNTVKHDNPSLTVRSWEGENPIRIVIDKELKLSKDLSVFNDDAATIIITEVDKYSDSQNIQYEQINFSSRVVEQICEVLYKNEIQSVIIEGGRKTLQSFIDVNLWDEARIFIGDKEFENGVDAPIIFGKYISESNIKNDVLKIIAND